MAEERIRYQQNIEIMRVEQRIRIEFSVRIDRFSFWIEGISRFLEFLYSQREREREHRDKGKG